MNRKNKRRQSVNRSRNISRQRTNIEFEPRSNRSARWEAFRRLENKITNTLKDLKSAVSQKNTRKMINARNQLLILLGECNFMAHEYTQIATNYQRRSA